MASRKSWEIVASHVLLHEISAHGLSIEDLSNHLEKLGVSLSLDRLTAQVSTGELPFTLLLQVALVAPIPEFSRFVDHSDLAEAAGVSTVPAAPKRDRHAGS